MQTRATPRRSRSPASGASGSPGSPAESTAVTARHFAGECRSALAGRPSLRAATQGTTMMPLRLIAPSGANDEESIKLLARADRARGADALVRTFREPLFHHAAYILKDYEEAIDVVQEVFIKALREPRLFTGDF